MKISRKIKLILLTIIIIVVIIIFILLLTNKKEKNENNLLKTKNPITEVSSVKEMKEYLGYDVPKLNKEVKSYIVIGDEIAVHARIIYNDGYEFDMEKGDAEVSGIFGAEKTSEKEIDNIKVEYYVYEGIYFIKWQNKDYSYSYSKSGQQLTTEEVSEIVSLTK